MTLIIWRISDRSVDDFIAMSPAQKNRGSGKGHGSLCRDANKSNILRG